MLRESSMLQVLVAGIPLQESTRNDVPVVIGPPNAQFELQIRNLHDHERGLFVLSVDGRSIVDGVEVSQHSPGYVLAPGQTLLLLEKLWFKPNRSFINPGSICCEVYRDGKGGGLSEFDHRRRFLGIPNTVQPHESKPRPRQRTFDRGNPPTRLEIFYISTDPTVRH